MCLSPISIPNPNYGKDPRKFPYKNVTDFRLSIPCGYCDDCIRLKQMYLVQRVQSESLVNHMFFCTLTYNNECMPILDLNGYKIRYADISDVQNMFKRLRKSNAFGIPFRYFGVSELGTKNGRPHFHLLLLFPKVYFDSRDWLNECSSFAAEHEFTILNEWRRNVSSTRNPEYINLCTFVRKRIRGKEMSNYDFHFVDPRASDGGTSDVGFYVLKYMLKPSPRAVRLQRAMKLNLDEASYEWAWNLVKPRYFKSFGFGLNGRADVRKHIYSFDSQLFDKLRSDVQVSAAGHAKFPQFFKEDGSSWPMSRYYTNHSLGIVTDADRSKFHELCPTLDSSEIKDSKSYSQIQTQLQKQNEIQIFTDGGFDSDDLDDLFVRSDH